MNAHADASLIERLSQAWARDGVSLDLHRKLEMSAEAAGLLDVAYTIIDSPVGALLLASTQQGLVRVAYEREGHDDVLASLAQRLSPRILRAPARLDSVARQIDEYFGGSRQGFDVPMDFTLSSGFRRVVQQHLPEIAFGATRSYAEVASMVGNPKAVRAVGTACATNPLPVVIPCHRVIRADGSYGGYIGGIEAKAILLTLEHAA